MRSRTRRLKSACLVMLVSGAVPRGPPATGEAGAVDDHASPVREVDLPLPPRRARLRRATGGWARTAAGRRCYSLEGAPTSFLRRYGEGDGPPSPLALSKKRCTRSMSAV